MVGQISPQEPRTCGGSNMTPGHCHARPFVRIFKSQFYKIFRETWALLAKSLQKHGQTAPRTGTGYPHEGLFVVRAAGDVAVRDALHESKRDR